MAAPNQQRLSQYLSAYLLSSSVRLQMWGIRLDKGLYNHMLRLVDWLQQHNGRRYRLDKRPLATLPDKLALSAPCRCESEDFGLPAQHRATCKVCKGRFTATST